MIEGMQRTSVQDFLLWFIDLINSTIIPLIFAIAIVFFIWNAARFFVFSGADEEGKASARRLMFYGIAAMVIMLSLWGIVRMMTNAFGIGKSGAPCPDFNPHCYSTGGNGAPLGNGSIFGTGYSGENGSTQKTGPESYFDLTNPGAGIQEGVLQR
jgi:hypothetical protein